MKAMTCNSRIPKPQHKKTFTLDRELHDLVHVLQRHEFLIIRSPHRTHNFIDHKPLLHCFTNEAI